MMQFVHEGDHPDKSSVILLPMIDMKSNDITCIYSTLKFIAEHAHHHWVTPTITFDQPLWWKALTVIQSEPIDSDMHKMVLRLGGFHAQMNFHVCIRHLMTGSGLQELLELIYAPKAVEKILAGQAVARATRRHFIVDVVLNAMLLSNLFGVPIPHYPAIIDVHYLVEEQPDSVLHMDQDDAVIHAVDSMEKIKYQPR